MQFGATTNTLYERPDARYLAEIVHGSPYGARISLQTVNGEWKHHEQTGDWGFLRLLRAGQPKLGAGGDRPNSRSVACRLHGGHSALRGILC